MRRDAQALRQPAASHNRTVSAIPSTARSHIETLQASATSWRTSSRPIPEPPPVTTAILPANSFMCAPSLGIGHALFERTACAEGSGRLPTDDGQPLGVKGAGQAGCIAAPDLPIIAK
jgi:hypothetical protein